MRPKDEEAAVWMIPPLHPISLYYSMNPITVNGLIIPEEAEDKGTSSPI